MIATNVVTDSLPGTYDVAVTERMSEVLSPEHARLAVKNIGGAVSRGSRVSPAKVVRFNLAFINA